MKYRYMILFVSLFAAAQTIANACEACQANQPKILRGITHGAGPQGPLDYVLVFASIILVLFTLFYAIKCFVRPGEQGADHIKRSILNLD